MLFTPSTTAGLLKSCALTRELGAAAVFFVAPVTSAVFKVDVSGTEADVSSLVIATPGAMMLQPVGILAVL
jgi:hypothetical protein